MRDRTQNTKAVVQVGLFKSTEYIYLVDEKYHHNWNIPLRLTEFESESAACEAVRIKDGYEPGAMYSDFDNQGEFFCPISQWHYYGVDLNAECIAHFNRIHADDDRVHFQVALLAEKDGEMHAHDGFYVGREGEQMQGTSLKSLFATIPMTIGLLALDIESQELPVLEGYDWSQHPRYIVIEVHQTKDFSRITEILQEQDYRLAELRRSGKTIQTGFIHRECPTNRQFIKWEH